MNIVEQVVNEINAVSVLAERELVLVIEPACYGRAGYRVKIMEQQGGRDVIIKTTIAWDDNEDTLDEALKCLLVDDKWVAFKNDNILNAEKSINRLKAERINADDQIIIINDMLKMLQEK